MADDVDQSDRVEILDGAAGDHMEIDKQQRITTPYMTKYERARILGARALQIRCVQILQISHIYWIFLCSMNAPVLVDAKTIDEQSDPLKIALKELQEKKIPFIIRRFLPSGRYEDWKASELVILTE